MVQQTLVQTLQPIFEPLFSEASYGYRPGRSAQLAMKKAKEYYEQGYTNVADIDLSKYFDTMDHELLMNLVRKEIKDKQIMDLIKKFLKSGVMEDGKDTEQKKAIRRAGRFHHCYQISTSMNLTKKWNEGGTSTCVTRHRCLYQKPQSGRSCN